MDSQENSQERVTSCVLHLDSLRSHRVEGGSVCYLMVRDEVITAGTQLISSRACVYIVTSKSLMSYLHCGDACTLMSYSRSGQSVPMDVYMV